MQFAEAPIHGSFLIHQTRYSDERGFFARAWCEDEFRAHGLSAAFVQCNDSFSVRRGTLRGLHYQAAPFGEVKLVRCVAGAIYDVIVDVRTESPTCGKWFGVELNATNRTMLYVPEGCAHGYLTLADNTEVIYPVTNAYHPEAEQGIRWDDPAFRVQWPDAGPLLISPKDRAWPDYQV